VVKVGSFCGATCVRNLDARNSKAIVISQEFIKVDKDWGSLSQYLQVFVLTVQDTSVLLYSTVVQEIFVLCVSLHQILLMYELAIYTVH
jgi:hypothetical protein